MWLEQIRKFRIYKFRYFCISYSQNLVLECNNNVFQVSFWPYLGVNIQLKSVNGETAITLTLCGYSVTFNHYLVIFLTATGFLRDKVYRIPKVLFFLYIIGFWEGDNRLEYKFLTIKYIFLLRILCKLAQKIFNSGYSGYIRQPGVSRNSVAFPILGYYFGVSQIVIHVCMIYLYAYSGRYKEKRHEIQKILH